VLRIVSGNVTLRALARREAVLLACLSVAAALVALGRAIEAQWLVVAGLGLALLGALARGAVAIWRTVLDKRQEVAEAERRRRVPVQRVGAVDPTDAGVDAAAPQEFLPGEEVPDYLPREADAEIRRAIEDAIDGNGRWIVVLVGRSKVGKSRALFEALRWVDQRRELQFISPVDGDAVRAELTPGEGPSPAREESVLWLDDLEPFLNQGITFRTLQEWRNEHPRGVVVATYGGKGSKLVSGADPDSLATVAQEVLQRSHEIPVPVTSPNELQPLRDQVSAGDLKAIEDHGLAAYLVAAPELERKITTALHASGERECPEGVALVRAAVDWARCGRTDALSEEGLRELWQEYLPPGHRPTEDGFKAGIEWGLRPVAGSVSLLEHVGGYRAYDYIVRFLDNRPSSPDPTGRAWELALRNDDPVTALGVGVTAYRRNLLDRAIEAFRLASRGSGSAAALAGLNLGISLGEKGKIDEEIAVYEEMGRRFQEEDAQVQAQVARALFNRAVKIGERGDRAAEIRGYDEIVERFGGVEAEAPRETVCRSLVNKGLALGKIGRTREELEVYEGVIARLEGAEEPMLQEQRAKAEVNWAVTLGELDQQEAELAAYDALIERYRGSPIPGVRLQLFRAFASKGMALGAAGDSAAEIRLYDEGLAYIGPNPGEDVETLEQVMSVLVNKGATLMSMDRNAEGKEAFAAVVAALEGTRSLALQAVLARALYNLAFVRGTEGDAEGELAGYEDLIERFRGAETESTSLARHLASAYKARAITLGELDRFDEELEGYDLLVEVFTDVDDPEVREDVIGALFRKGLRLSELERPEEEIETLSEIIGRFEGSTHLADQRQVAGALYVRGRRRKAVGDLDGALEDFERLIKSDGNTQDPELRLIAAEGLISKAVLVGELGHHDEELETYDQAVERLREGSDGAAIHVARVLSSKGKALGREERFEDAIAAFDEALDELPPEPEDAEGRYIRSATLVAKGLTLGRQGRNDDASGILIEVIAANEDEEDSRLRRLVEVARRALEEERG